MTAMTATPGGMQSLPLVESPLSVEVARSARGVPSPAEEQDPPLQDQMQAPCPALSFQAVMHGTSGTVVPYGRFANGRDKSLPYKIKCKRRARI